MRNSTFAFRVSGNAFLLIFIFIFPAEMFASGQYEFCTDFLDLILAKTLSTNEITYSFTILENTGIFRKISNLADPKSFYNYKTLLEN